MDTQEQEAAEQLRRHFEMMISDKYKSISSFASTHGMDKSDLSKFLRGKKDWQLLKVIKLLIALKGELEIKSIAEDHTNTGRLTLNLQFDEENGAKFWKWFSNLANENSNKQP